MFLHPFFFFFLHFVIQSQCLRFRDRLISDTWHLGEWIFAFSHVISHIYILPLHAFSHVRIVVAPDPESILGIPDVRQEYILNWISGHWALSHPCSTINRLWNMSQHFQYQYIDQDQLLVLTLILFNRISESDPLSTRTLRFYLYNNNLFRLCVVIYNTCVCYRIASL